MLLLMCQSVNASQLEPQFLTGQLGYPLLAQKAGHEGELVLEVTTDAEGRVTQVDLISSSGSPLFFWPVRQKESPTWRFSAEGKAKLHLSYRRMFKGTRPLQETLVREGPNRFTVLLVYPEYYPAHPQHPTRCTRHGCSLERDLVPVAYGLVLPEREPIFRRFLIFLHLAEPGDYLNARKRLFPFAYSVAFGGCIIQEYAKEEVFYCRLCREREARWKRDHKWPSRR